MPSPSQRTDQDCHSRSLNGPLGPLFPLRQLETQVAAEVGTPAKVTGQYAAAITVCPLQPQQCAALKFRTHPQVHPACPSEACHSRLPASTSQGARLLLP